MHQDPPDPVALFEEDGLWQRFTDNPYVEELIRTVREMVPESAQSILDVGCGNGVLVRSFSGERSVLGIDPSVRGLKTFEEPRICGVGERLPIRDGTFDAVCCLEVLEHLTDDAIAAVSRELARVSRRWLLIATPDREDPRRNSLRCPSCGHIFNRSHHLQSFDESRLKGLFPDFEHRSTRRAGQPVRPYPYPLLWVRHRLARRFFKGPGETSGLCPNCGTRTFPPFRPNLLSVLMDGLNRLISPRRPYWILMLLERRQGGSIVSD